MPQLMETTVSSQGNQACPPNASDSSLSWLSSRHHTAELAGLYNGLVHQKKGSYSGHEQWESKAS